MNIRIKMHGNKVIVKVKESFELYIHGHLHTVTGATITPSGIAFVMQVHTDKKTSIRRHYVSNETFFNSYWRYRKP